MSQEAETYCRLCAEPTPLVQMLSADKDVASSSKLITKLSWLNVDISLSSGLPCTICFSCLDLLDRTWIFFNAVRAAQEKLISILLKKTNENLVESDIILKDADEKITDKTVNKDWEILEDLKHEIKIEISNEKLPNSAQYISKENNVSIKTEAGTDDDDLIIDSNDNLDRFSSSDSDVPLKKCVKKKRGRPKHKSKKVCSETDTGSNISIDILASSVTWDNQACLCAKCDAQCKSILSLQLHSLEIHDRCCIFKCVQCGKVLAGYRSFVRHMRTHNNILRHCCEYCNKMFLYLPELAAHKMKYHKMVFRTKCTNCGANYETPEELEEHKSLFFKSPKEKKLKVKSTDINMDYKCDQCRKVFKSRGNLQQHMQLHTERTKEFACHICGKMFYTKGTLGTHLIVHEEKRPHKCHHCPLAFRAKGNLISHMSLHTGLKPFICEQCGKSFRVKRHLISHSIVHTDLRPYVCEYCNKSFRFKTRLNLHLRQHTGVRPYKCIYCQRDFTNGSNYKKHMKRRHGIDTSTRFSYKNVNNVKKGLDDTNETIM